MRVLPPRGEHRRQLVSEVRCIQGNDTCRALSVRLGTLSNYKGFSRQACVPRAEFAQRRGNVPYFHDGREPKLKEAVNTMAKAQLGRSLKDDESSQIAAYLKSLTGEYHGKQLTGPASESD